MKTHPWKNGRISSAFAALPLALILISAPAFAHSWASFNAPPYGLVRLSIGLMLLLPDGTVLANTNSDYEGAAGWYLLTPDSSGHYVDGTWTALSSMNDPRLFFSSQVLPDGRVFVAGGEYPSSMTVDGVSTAEIYDPKSDSLNPGHEAITAANPWTQINPPTALLNPAIASPALSSGNQAFIDSTSELLPAGNVLIAPVGPSTRGGTLNYNPTTNIWAYGGTLANNVPYQDEASWVKLPDNSIVTIDPYGQNSQRFIPSSSGTSGSWVSDATVPVPIYDSIVKEEGGAVLLPNGKAFFQGGTGNTVIYTPSGTTANGAWIQGPGIPQGLAPDDAACAMMNNGKILCAESPKSTSNVTGNPGTFPPPTSFFEYDYSVGATGTFTEVGAPYGFSGGPNTLLQAPAPCYQFEMLDLPDGTVLVSNFSGTLYIYTPDANTNPTVASLKPTISSVTQGANGSYVVTGTLLNGISEGAAYGDDAQMSSNYPIVSLTNGSNVYYARTHNWSSTGVRQVTQTVTTEFDPPLNLPVGTYSLAVIANGIRSAPYTFTFSSPIVWVDFSYAGIGTGAYGSPYNTMAFGLAAAANGGTIEIEDGGSSSETPTITSSGELVVYAYNGPTIIGSTAPKKLTLKNKAISAPIQSVMTVKPVTSGRAVSFALPHATRPR